MVGARRRQNLTMLPLNVSIMSRRHSLICVVLLLLLLINDEGLFLLVEVARPGNFVSNFCVVFLLHYGEICKILFGMFSPPHRSTLLCSNVVKFVRQEIMKLCVIYLTEKKLKFPLPPRLSLRRYCQDRAQSLPGPAPSIWLTLFQISSVTVEHFN